MTSRSSRSRKRSHQGHPARVAAKVGPQPSGVRIGGVPVYDGFVVETATGESFGQRDDRVLIGIGPEGGRPSGYLMLCPCDGVADFVRELQDVAAAAAEHHPGHLRG